jgi:polysaccharide deacetylase family protein (PEP-CTERM system associated)
MNSPKYILLTIDVEDWFQVENFKPWIPFETWDQRELRVEKNVHRLLDLFDSLEVAHRAGSIAHGAEDKAYKTEELKNFRRRRIGISQFHPGTEKIKKYPENPVNPVGQNNNKIESNPRSNYELKSNEQRDNHKGNNEAATGMPSSLPAFQPSSPSRPKATFFVLGWLADRLPHLVREIQSRGHEVASHGYNHILCNEQSPAALKKELTDSKKKLEDIIGSAVFGYRAPNFSVNDDILKLIEDCGYLYDSSYNSFALHGRYGKVSLNGSSKKGLAHQMSADFFELPISNIHIRYPLSFEPSALSPRKRFVLPWGGGAYFRLMPFPIFKLGVKNILNKENAYLFYLHPWEIDPDQPVVKNAPARFKFRHYSNLSKSLNKLIKFIDSFPKCQFITCSQYLKSIRQDLQD